MTPRTYLTFWLVVGAVYLLANAALTYFAVLLAIKHSR
jgi:hypothetical protein